MRKYHEPMETFRKKPPFVRDQTFTSFAPGCNRIRSRRLRQRLFQQLTRKYTARGGWGEMGCVGDPRGYSAAGRALHVNKPPAPDERRDCRIQWVLVSFSSISALVCSGVGCELRLRKQRCSLECYGVVVAAWSRS